MAVGVARPQVANDWSYRPDRELSPMCASAIRSAILCRVYQDARWNALFRPASARSTRTIWRRARRVKHLTILVRIVRIQLKAPVGSARFAGFSSFTLPKVRGRGDRKPRGTCRMGKRSSNGPPRGRVFGLPAARGGLRPHAGFHGAAAASLPFVCARRSPVGSRPPCADSSAPGAYLGLTLRPVNLCTASSRHRLASLMRISRG